MKKHPLFLILTSACLGFLYPLIIHCEKLTDVAVYDMPEQKTVPSATPVMDNSPNLTREPAINQESVEAMNSYASSISPISDTLYERIYKKSYKQDCTVPLTDLSYLTVSYYGFDHVVHTGELIVNKDIAEKTISIFRELFEAEYPIEKICLVDDYDADDNASMSANNTSCFNYRTIDGTSKLSNHSKGRAIDINPLYNPYVRTFNGNLSVLPENGSEYADRTGDCPYMIQKGDICYNIFIKYGFTWGGEWNSSKDYQHFEI